MTDPLTHGSLFSGIGGFERGAEIAGIETHWACEIEPYNRAVIARHYPNTTIYEDVRDLRHPRRVDIISGGFPCQDISLAGRGAGIGGARSGLWAEYARIIGEVRPRYAIIENSPALVFRGLDRVLSDLAALGYDAEWQCLENAHFGFPHARERLYIVAHSMQKRYETEVEKHGEAQGIFRIGLPKAPHILDVAQGFYSLADSDSIRADDGLPNWVDRVGACGNAVNPAVAAHIFNCIKAHARRTP